MNAHLLSSLVAIFADACRATHAAAPSWPSARAEGKKEERKSGEVDAARKGRAAGACVWSEAEAPEVEEGGAAV